MQSSNGRQAVMSALEAMDLAGKGLNAFSVLFILQVLYFLWHSQDYIFDRVAAMAQWYK
jgi:hypothetical protein